MSAVLYVFTTTTMDLHFSAHLTCNMYLIPGGVSFMPRAPLPPSETTVIVIRVFVLVLVLMFVVRSEVQTPHDGLQIYTTQIQPAPQQKNSRIQLVLIDNMTNLSF